MQCIIKYRNIITQKDTQCCPNITTTFYFPLLVLISSSSFLPLLLISISPLTPVFPLAILFSVTQLSTFFFLSLLYSNFFSFRSTPCARVNCRLSVSFQAHVKALVSYRIVSYRRRMTLRRINKCV